MSSKQDDFFSGLMWAIAASAVIGAVLIIGWFMIFLAPMYIGYRLYIDSPKRKERVAREHTIALYEAELEPQCLQFFKPKPIEFVRELRKAGVALAPPA